LSLIITSSISALLAIYIWRRRPASGAAPFALIMAAVAEWSLAYGLRVGSVDLPTKIFWSQIRNIGTAVTPVAWLVFALQYTGRKEWLTRRNVIFLAIEPFIAMLLAWTNKFHGLIWSSTILDTSGSFPVLITTHGIGHQINVVYSYLLLLLGMALLTQMLIRSPSLYRRQTSALLIIVLAPLVGDICSILHLFPSLKLNLTPFTFTIVGLAAAWGLFRYRLFDIAPVARDTIVENMSEAVIVLDTQDRIVDLNPAAERLIEHTSSKAIGQLVTQVLPVLETTVKGYHEKEEKGGENREDKVRTTISVEKDVTRYIHDLHVSPLYNRRGRLTGRLMVLRDITKLRQAEEELRHAAENALYESKARHTALFESAHDAILLIKDDIFINCNLRTLEIYGCERKEIIGQTPYQFSPQQQPDGRDSQEQMLEKIEAALNGQAQFFDWKHCQLDGTPFDAAVSLSRVALGRELYIQAIVRDITERKRAIKKVQQQAAQAALIYEIGQRLSEELELNTLLSKVVTAVHSAFDYYNVMLLLLDEKKERLTLQAIAGGYSETFSDDLWIAIEEGMIGHAAKTGETYVSGNVSQNPHYVRKARERTQSELVTPIKSGEKIIGTLDIQSNQPNAFDESDVVTMETLADQVAIAIENARLYEQAQRRMKSLINLHLISRTIASSLDVKGVLEQIVDLTGSVVDSDYTSMVLLDEDGKPELGMEDFRGIPSITHRIRGGGVTDFILDNRQPVVVNAIADDRTTEPLLRQSNGEVIKANPSLRAGSIRSFAAAPIQAKGKILGVLFVHSRQRGAFHDQHSLLSTFANQIAMAIENARLYEEIEQELAERKQVEEALRDSEKRFRSTAETASDAIIAFDDQENIFFWNLAAQTIFGYQAEETQGQSLASVMSDQVYKVLQREIKQVSAGEASLLGKAVESIGIRKDGSQFPLELSLASWETQEDVFFTAIARDITERKRAEDALQQRNRELALLNRASQTFSSTLDLSNVLATVMEEIRRLLNVIACSIWLVDSETRELVCRQATGAQSEDVLGWRMAPGSGLVGWVAQNDESLIVPDAYADDRYFQGVDQRTGLLLHSILGVPLRVQQEVIGVLQVLDTEADRFDAADVALVEPLAASASIAIENARLHREVLDHAEQLEQRVQKRTAEIQAQYARQDAILRSVSDGIIVTDADGKITQSNPVAQKWLTHTLSPDDAEQLREAIQNLARSIEEQSKKMLELTSLDLKLNAAPILIQKEKIKEEKTAAPAVVVVAHDISHLKALDRMKTRFVSNVSHELRTPITTIKLYAELMQQKPEKWQEYITALSREANRQAQLVEDILQVSRIDAGRLEIMPRPTSLNSLTETTVVNHQALAQKQEVTLVHRPMDTSGSKSKLVILADPKRTLQALNNLVENGIRYTPKGGEVVISTDTAEIEGRVWATATVTDTGIGIPDEELPHIFDRFFRGKEPQMMQVSGTGLGLAIVKEVIELHGGRVTVESQVNEGSSFTIWFSLID